MKKPAAQGRSFSFSGSLLRPPHRHRQRLRADEALEAPDDRPDRAEAQGGAAVDRLDAGLADDRRAGVAVVLDPVAEEHADGAALVPLRELVGAAEPRVVARERPDAPAQPGDEMAVAVLEDRE